MTLRGKIVCGEPIVVALTVHLYCARFSPFPLMMIAIISSAAQLPESRLILITQR